MADTSLNLKVLLQGNVSGTDQFDRFSSSLATVGKTADSVNRQMATLTGGMKLLAAGFGAGSLTGMVSEFARVSIQLDAFSKQLSIGFGEVNTAELEKLRAIMRDLGISEQYALGQAVRFTSAMKLSGQTASEANANFAAASKLILSNKLTEDQANRVYYAMSQIASRGKLYQEQLGRELGKTLAGFTSQLATAMGISSAQLQDNMKKGKVSASDFFAGLRGVADGIDPSKLDSSARRLNMLNNAIFDLKSKMLDSGTIKTVLTDAGNAAKFLADNAETLATVLSYGLAASLGKAAQAMYLKTTASIEATRVERALATQTAASTEATLASIAADYEKAKSQAAITDSELAAAEAYQTTVAFAYEEAAAKLELAKQNLRLSTSEYLEADAARNSTEFKEQMIAANEAAVKSEAELSLVITEAAAELRRLDGALAAADAELLAAAEASNVAAIALARTGEAAAAAGLEALTFRDVMGGLLGMLGGWQGLAFMGAAVAIEYLTSQQTEAEKATRAVEAADKAMGSYQLTLGELLDERTGKHKQLTEALEAQYLAQLKVNAAEAVSNAKAARTALSSDVENKNGGSWLDLMGQAFINQSAAESGDSKGFVNYGASDAAKSFSSLIQSDNLTADKLVSAVAAARRSGVQGIDDRYVSTLAKALNDAEVIRIGEKIRTLGVNSLNAQETATAKVAGLPGFPSATVMTGVTDTKKHADPFASAEKELGRTNAGLAAQTVLWMQNGHVIEATNKAQAEFDVSSAGRFANESDQRKKAWVALNAQKDKLEELLKAEKLYTEEQNRWGEDKAKNDFELAHWDLLHGKIKKAAEAEFEFNLARGAYKGLPQAEIGKLSEKARADDASKLAVTQQAEADALAKAEIGWKRETEAVTDQYKAVTMSAEAYKLMVERKQALAQIDEHVANMDEKSAAEYRKKAQAWLEEKQAAEKAYDAWTRSAEGGAQIALHAYKDDIDNLGKHIGDAMNNAFKGAEDALVNFCMTGKLNFTDFANSIIKDLIRIAIQQSIMKWATTLMNFIPGMGAPSAALSADASATIAANPGIFATGGAFDTGGVRKFATGDVFDSPTMFGFGGNKLGVMGEAGPEAIMPLKRGADGKLGIAGGGGGSVNNVTVNMNVDGGSSQVTSSSGHAAQLGQAISRAVQAEIVKQRRPGGLLAA